MIQVQKIPIEKMDHRFAQVAVLSEQEISQRKNSVDVGNVDMSFAEPRSCMPGQLQALTPLSHHMLVDFAETVCQEKESHLASHCQLASNAGSVVTAPDL